MANNRCQAMKKLATLLATLEPMCEILRKYREKRHNGIVGVRGSNPLGSTIQNTREKGLFMAFFPLLT